MRIPGSNDALAAQARLLEHVVFANCTHDRRWNWRSAWSICCRTGLTRVFYSDNGSTAVEVAMKMALQYWGNQGDARHTFVTLRACLSRRYGRRDVGQRRFDLHASLRIDVVRRRAGAGRRTAIDARRSTGRPRARSTASTRSTRCSTRHRDRGGGGARRADAPGGRRHDRLAERVPVRGAPVVRRARHAAHRRRSAHRFRPDRPDVRL